ncbi:MAG: hypothetical protein ACI9P9_000820, partial [Patescibacteria group bacterium]
EIDAAKTKAARSEAARKKEELALKKRKEKDALRQERKRKQLKVKKRKNRILARTMELEMQQEERALTHIVRRKQRDQELTIQEMELGNRKLKEDVVKGIVREERFHEDFDRRDTFLDEFIETKPKKSALTKLREDLK